MEFNITHTDVSSEIVMLDSDFDQSGNRIKLRSESLRNTRKHLKNVPYHVADVPKIVSSKIKDSDEKNVVTEKHDDTIEVKQEDVVEAIEEKSEEVEKVTAKKTEESMTKNDSTYIPNLDDTFVGLKQAREQLENMQLAAIQAQQEADESDKELNRVSIEEAEVQKKLEETLARQNRIQEEIAAILKKQSSTLAEAQKQHEDSIGLARKKTENNQSKIIEFKNKIGETKEHILDLENHIAAQQEILNRLSQLEMINHSNSDLLDSTLTFADESEEISKGRRVA